MPLMEVLISYSLIFNLDVSLGLLCSSCPLFYTSRSKDPDRFVFNANLKLQLKQGNCTLT